MKVQAGLTPKDIAIGVAHELSNVKLPETMIISGGSEGKGTNPWDAIGLNSFYDLSKKVAGNKIQK